MPRRLLLSVLVLALAATPASAQEPPADAPVAPVAPVAPEPPPVDPPLPVDPPRPTTGRAIAGESADACLAELRRAGVAFDALAPDVAPGVETPVRLRGPVDGIEVAPRGGRPDGPTAVLDCRLVLALVAWAPTLHAAGVTRIEHYSCYRAHAFVAGSATPSAHAAGLAIDAALFHLEDGRVLDVARDWGDRTRGEDPCTPREGDGSDARLLRTIVCEAAREELFEVVLTPHFDAAHGNHVHLEVRPGVDWSYVH